MTTEYKFVDTIGELAESTLEFYHRPEFWKPALGSSPKYFVHINIKGAHAFGLSKFCAFKNITLEDYLTIYRYKTDGGTTQNHITWLTGQKWIKRNEIDLETRKSFDDWISQFFPNYSLKNASFITLTNLGTIKRVRKKFISPSDLQDKLKLQTRIGKVGEQIAILHEIQRLKERGIKNPIKCIDHVSKRNSAAGYDIYSSTNKETRYIEVKSSLNDNREFFITENEVQTLESFGRDSFLYLVHITDLKKGLGQVYKMVSDPIRQLRQKRLLKAIAYKAEIPNNL